MPWSWLVPVPFKEQISCIRIKTQSRAVISNIKLKGGYKYLWLSVWLNLKLLGEKEGARRELFLQTSNLIIHPEEIFVVFPVALGLASVCSKIPSCGFTQNGNFSDAANQGCPSFPRRKTMEELSGVFSFGNGEDKPEVTT